MQHNSKAAFELGQIVATPDALAALKKAGQHAGEFLTRHVNRDSYVESVWQGHEVRSKWE